MVHRLKRVFVPFAEIPLSNLYRAAEQGFSLRKESEILIHRAHYAHHPGLQEGVMCQPGIDLLRCLVENLAGGDAVASCRAGVREPLNIWIMKSVTAWEAAASRLARIL